MSKMVESNAENTNSQIFLRAFDTRSH